MIPHTKTARMLIDVVRAGESSIEAIGRISPQHPAVQDGRAAAFLGIELGAQCAAALLGTDDREGPRPHTEGGYLVRIRDAVFNLPDLPAGEDLRAIADLEGAAGPLSMFRIRVFAGDLEAMTATITVHQS